MTVWLVRIWTYKNADEKAHTLSRRSKNVKKRTKTYEKRILCKFTLRMGQIYCRSIYGGDKVAGWLKWQSVAGRWSKVAAMMQSWTVRCLPEWAITNDEIILRVTALLRLN